MKLVKTEIDNLELKRKLNLINSISGIKPANLIATRSEAGEDNVAIFSSVIHLAACLSVGESQKKPKKYYLNK